MAFKQLVSPNFGATDYAGNCLPMAQKVVGAGGGPYSATVAANATKYQHWDRNLPSDSIAVLWFTHWGTYTDYRNGERRWEDWGHVVIWSPSAFGEGRGGFFSSPSWDNGYPRAGEWFSSIADVEATFSSEYRFWSEDLNGVRVCAPVAGVPAASKPAVAKPPVLGMENDMIVMYKHANGKNKPGWLILGYTPNALVLSSQDSANEWNRHIGKKTIETSYEGFLKYLHAANPSKAQLDAVSRG